MKGISCQLCIQIRRNQITVRDLESKREVSGDAAFSNQRLLIANFFVAEKVLQLHPRSTWHSFLPAKRMDIVVSALEMNEGGLSQVEERILHEVVAGATLMKYRQFHIHAQSAVLSDSAVMAMLKQK
ncbi:TPA: hypothetical protein N6711_003118 [Escherichia coli]|nr:hypothetical protein [Escherichia coli]